VSIEWFPVQCTLRLNFFMRVVIYMAMPIISILVPIVFVLIMAKCTPLLRRFAAGGRRAKRRGVKVGACRAALLSVVSAFGDDLVTKKTKEHTRLNFQDILWKDELETLHAEIDVLLDELEVAEKQVALLSALNGPPPAEPSTLPPETGAATLPSERAADAVADEEGENAPPLALLPLFATRPVVEDDVHEAAIANADTMLQSRMARVLDAPATASGGASASATDNAPPLAPLHSISVCPPEDLAPAERTGSRFFEVVSAKPISLRATPAHSADKTTWVVHPGDVISTDVVERHSSGGNMESATRYVKLSGSWGEGWVFCTHINPVSGNEEELLREVESSTVINAVMPTFEAYHRDEVMHCFRAICAIATEATADTASRPDCISREAIEYVLPASMSHAKQHNFFAGYDADGDGTLDLGEFVAMYPALRAEWRLEHAWAEFQHLDSSGDGKLEMDELQSLVPQGASEGELRDWMARFDNGGKGYLSIGDFLAIDAAVRRDTLLLGIGTSFVLCTYFVYSRVTKALLSVFSMENIEGTLYLKREVGTPAFTLSHIVMMGISGAYIAVFTVLVPVLGLYMMYQVRHKLDERRVATMAGFLADGYRSNYAWFWEFVVLARKLIILMVSLYIWEPFLQTFFAIVALMVSLSVQLYVNPFELIIFNILEAASLASLLATQLVGMMMWYKSQAGNTDNFDLYRRASIVILFVANGAVIFGFVAVAVWFYLKQKSKAIVQWLPFALPFFESLLRAEEWARWASGQDISIEQELELREDWSFVAPRQIGTLFTKGAAYTTRKKTAKLAAKLSNAAQRIAQRLRKADRTTGATELDGVNLIALAGSTGVVRANPLNVLCGDAARADGELRWDNPEARMV
jgi:hypothetical protein